MNSAAALRIDDPAPPAGDGGPAAPAAAIEAWVAATQLPGDRFDAAAAAHAESFFPRFLRHTKGRWAGRPFALLPWQRAVVRAAFGWKRADGTRRFRRVYLFVGRKNGKTAFAAGLALYLAFFAGEAGAEVYCAATITKQALIVFNEAARMRALSPFMKAFTLAFKFNLNDPESFSKLEVLSAESGTKDGLNVSGFIGDEIHAWRDRNLYDVLATATGARAQPLEIYLTTAGEDMNSLWGEMHEHALEVAARRRADHGLLPVLFAADPNDDPFDERVWPKANPSLNETISIDYLREKARQARQLPRHLNAFKRLHLNIPTEQHTLWLPMDKWDACGRGAESVTLEALAGRPCWGGFDLSAVADLTALALVFDRPGSDAVDLWAHFWLPREGLAERVARDGVPLDEWARRGFITLTEGNVVDYAALRLMISGVAEGADAAARDAFARAALASRVQLREIARDRWNATYLTTQLMGDGVAMVEFGQGFASMSAPAKHFEKLVLEGKLNHGGNPVLRWMAQHAAVAQDPAGNLKPVKPDRRQSKARIDGIVAAVMALGRAIADGAPGPSVYEQRGVLVL